jgi:hypothetical protein
VGEERKYNYDLTLTLSSEERGFINLVFKIMSVTILSYYRRGL